MRFSKKQKKLLKKRQKAKSLKREFKKIRHEKQKALKRKTRLGGLLTGISFPDFPALFMNNYLTWNDFLSIRRISRRFRDICDLKCIMKWKHFLQKNYSFLIPTSENEWNIFFPNIKYGCFRDLTLEITKVLHLTVQPIILHTPKIGNREASAITAYTFPWYYVCKFLDFPITSGCCYDFNALRSFESYVRLDDNEIVGYASLCIGDFLKQYALKKGKTVSFISRINPMKAPNFLPLQLPINYKSGPIVQLANIFPEVLESFPKGRQVAFTIFIHNNNTFNIWLSRLNANPDVVEEYQKQLNYYVNSHYY